MIRTAKVQQINKSSFIQKSLGSRDIKIKTVEIAESGLDEFITRGNFQARNWEVYELTQAQDVTEWVENPSKIQGIASNLKHLRALLVSYQSSVGFLGFGYLKALFTGRREPIKFLDVGCYGGYVYDYLTQSDLNYSEQKFQYFGVDIQPDAIEGCRQMHINTKNATFQVADVFQLNRTFSKSFDIVFCSRVLIHLPHFEKAIKNLLDVAKRHVVIFVRIEDKDYVKRINETQLKDNSVVEYYFRVLSENTVRKVVEDYKGKCTCNIIHEEGYSTVIYSKI